MEVMPCQYQMLREALSGYEKTGVPLVAYDGNVLKPAGIGDDIGLYYFLPKISHVLGISLDQSINVIFISVIFVSLSLGIIGSFLYFRKRAIKWLGVVELILLALGSYFVSGIYIILSSITIAIIPLFLYFARQRRVSSMFIIFLFFAGLAISITHHLRSHAGTGVLIFMTIIFLISIQIQWKQKFILILLLMISVSAPMIYFDKIMKQRDVYLTKNDSTYEPFTRGHPFWHSVYIGFGFLSNEYGIKYKDEIAIEKVHSISPKTLYLSQEYEVILRDEVFNLIKKHPLFVTQTIFAKLGVNIFYFLIFSNVGLIAVVLHRKTWQLEIAFFSAMLFNSFFSIIAIPDYRYLMGFIAFATLYGIISIDDAIEHVAWKKIITIMHRGREKSRCVG
jgi:MFS family permease